ncbi:MAG: FKBP-type peptidyl-prolyl cis-trans isomerase [Bacteroidales bacterium]|nr:FKBP-type peptidyl-prolyl cis-trans isomerase [Bacteroidales bacterium]
MKKFFIIAIAALCLCGCAKTKTTSDMESAKRYLDAWVHVQKQKHPEYLWKQTGLGSWILEETEGKGEAVGEFTDSSYLRLSYSITQLDGTIASTTYKSVSQQLGSYDETYYYGPVTMYANGMYAGVEEAIKGMKPGGRKKILIPSWLITYNRFDDADGYLGQSSDDIGTTSIYDLELVECFEYIQQWSADSLGRYLVANYPSKYGTNPVKAVADSSGAFGFYYICRQAPEVEMELKDTTVYINYTGRLLNGQVFDTTIRDTAIRYGLKRDKTYEPVSISYGSSWSSISMSGESTKVIPGFARTLSKMGPYEKGTGVFISSLGYSYSGSGYTIPAYSPLRFDIELVDNPND